MHDALIPPAHRPPGSTLVMADKMLQRVARLRRHPVRALQPAPGAGRRQGLAGGGAERRAALGLADTAPEGAPVAVGHAEHRQGEEAEEEGAGAAQVCPVGEVFVYCAAEHESGCPATMANGRQFTGRSN